MIPPHKLAELPRHQRLRKAGKIIAEAENRLCAADALPGRSGDMAAAGFPGAEERVLLTGIAAMFAEDPLFQEAARTAFANAAELLSRTADEPCRRDTLRRCLNAMRHILLAETGRSPADWDFIGDGGKLDPARRRSFPGMLAYLEDIRSPFNVGAMFRTAESFGLEKIILSPLCADPRHPRAERSAMGCVDALPWERRALCAVESGPLFALETGGTPLEEFPFPARGLLIAGSEELGVSPGALAAADASLGRVSIPCYGAKGSLNVSVAFGIVMRAWAYKLASHS
jgi:TrmH family RNA methyltransferase